MKSLGCLGSLPLTPDNVGGADVATSVQNR
jgi:hypothetical protein